MWLKKYLLLGCVWLVGCSNSPQLQHLPIQSVENRLLKVEQRHPHQQMSLLAIQYLPNQWRWVQTDPLGVPLARLILDKQGWRNDGFIPPNAQAKLLFSAISNYLNPQQAVFYGTEIANGDFLIDGKFAWKMTKDGKKVHILLADLSEWRVEELE